MKILVTGSSGFIGAALTMRLLERGDVVIGLDNHNNYYDPALKEARVSRFINHSNYTHLRLDLADREGVRQAFETHQPKKVVNLAAQAGVRYSLENPLAYIDSNILGFAHVLEGCRAQKVEHLVYASTSSVYGANTELPFSVHQNVDHPLSLYAATKKSNELMAHSYSHLYGLPTTGLRFFTVYGPWGRPDMALFKFTQAIIKDESIKIFNHGKHRRDFTYIDDIVEGVIRVLDHRIYNIGNSQPIELMEYVAALENALGKVAQKEWLPIQPGDVPDTHADVSELIEQFDYFPATTVQEGVSKFVTWYKDYNKFGKEKCS